MTTAPTFESISAKQLMNKVNAPSMPFQWSINPYRGCTHGCSFCYARTTHTFMGLTADDTFRQHVFMKENAAEVLERELHRKLRSHHGDYEALARAIGLVNIGTATDPYQPIEARQKLTRQCLEVLAHYQVPTSITTRSPLILRDIDILQQMRLQAIHISVNTLDKTIWRNLEPSTPSPVKRLEAIQTLSHEDLPVGVLLAPILPFLTDSNEHLSEVLDGVASHGAQFAIPSILRLNGEVKSWFLQTLRTHDPELESHYTRLYRGAYASTSYSRLILARAHKLLHQRRIPSYAPTDPVKPRILPSDNSHSVQLLLPI